MSLDARRFPEASAYLVGLGGRLDAYPECQSKSVYFTDMAEAFPQLLTDESLSPAVQESFRRPWGESEWMPSIPVVLLLTLVYDSVHRDDESFLAWNFERQLRIYRQPMFRALMFLMSPTLLFMGAARKWPTFHRGSELVVKGSKHRADLTLRFPAGLYSRVFIVSLVAAYRAALHAAKADRDSVELISWTATEARYTAAWE